MLKSNFSKLTILIKFEFRFLVEDGDYISNDVIGYVDIRAKGKNLRKSK